MKTKCSLLATMALLFNACATAPYNPKSGYGKNEPTTSGAIGSLGPTDRNRSVIGTGGSTMTY
jgi:hypothetical protein